MTDVYDAGDWHIPTLTVAEGDGTTAAAVTVTNPATGAATVLTTTSSDGGKTWEAAAYELVVAGDWVERWDVTGSGAGKQRLVVSVAPDPTATASGTRVYATTTDYANHLLTACPPGARRALIAASRRVDEMLLTAVYDVNADSMPTDAEVTMALRDATCLQAEYGRFIGTAAAAGAPGVTSASIGSVNVSRQQPAGGGPTSPYSAAAFARLRELPSDKISWEVGT
ncbi:hypothetical protein [Dactylosporangium salmoneum]|uniref:Uncharacterized protein n=1 Tax=Dactylosporangium salmoneum TaxID=53361 RepID=A0ABP5SCH9_9ACTN